jgi:predicted DNA-binding transcriptional regulator YafY
MAIFWKKAKALAMLANRRQWQRDFDPVVTAGIEIEIEQGGYFIITQASNAATPNYIITE